jgi:hypothetical protein
MWPPAPGPLRVLYMKVSVSAVQPAKQYSLPSSTACQAAVCHASVHIRLLMCNAWLPSVLLLVLRHGQSGWGACSEAGVALSKMVYVLLSSEWSTRGGDYYSS